MKVYLDLMRNTMENGIDEFNTRTGHNCRAIVGTQLVFDCKEGFPATTTKKLAFKSVVGELIGFMNGCDNAEEFRKLGCKIWDQNANENAQWLASPYRKGHDDLGRIYGVQWTDWKDRRVIYNDPVEFDRLTALGFEEKMRDPIKNLILMERGINQLENALRTLITDPSNRRIIVSAWNPAEFDMMALPPCHMDYRFVAFSNPKVLHVVMTIRSWDEFLGAPFNIASTALFLAIMARLAGYEPGTVTIQATNAHVYDNHIDQINEQLCREPLPLAKLIISDKVKQITNLSDIPGVFTYIQPEDIWLEDYISHAAIKAPMAV